MFVFAVAVVCDNFAAGMGSTVLVALYMRVVDKRYTAAQFSIFVGIATLPRILSGPIAAMLQSWFGWVGVYELAFVLALGFIPFLIKIQEQVNSDKNQVNSNEAEQGVMGDANPLP